MNILINNIVQTLKYKSNIMNSNWLSSCTKYSFDKSNFVSENTKKNQIVLHHTVGGSAESSINTWIQDPSRICTHIVIERDGTCYQLFPLKFWGYHLYVGEKGNKVLSKYKINATDYDKQSIGIELCSYGPLKVFSGRFCNLYNKNIPKENVYYCDYKGYKYWEKYTIEQINALKKVLKELLLIYPHIQKEINFQDFNSIFNINTKALDKIPGIYSHTSYRTTKSDIYPNDDLIKMLESLKIINYANHV